MWKKEGTGENKGKRKVERRSGNHSLSEKASRWISCSHITTLWNFKKMFVCLAVILPIDLCKICPVAFRLLRWHVSHLGRAGYKGVPWNKSCKNCLLFSSFSHIKIWDCHSQSLQIWRGQFCRWHCADTLRPSYSLHWVQNVPLEKRHSVQNHVSFRGAIPRQSVWLSQGE